MAQVVTCSRCQQPIPAGAPLGECPGCLFRLGLPAETPDGWAGGTVAASVAAAADRPPAHAHARIGPPTAPGDGPSPGAGVLPHVPGYDLYEEIGRGGNGVVFRARHRALDRVVAVKFLLSGLGTAVERQRFRTEAHALGRLNHPNAVHVYEVGEAGGCPYLTMEYVPGGSLADREIGTVPPAVAAGLIEPIARMLHAAHAAGVVHRDLKPGNVLLAADGSPKLTDFGIARVTAPGGRPWTDQLTQELTVLGTPEYMAPEQADPRRGPVGPATDVYGLGAVLYHLLTGRGPTRPVPKWARPEPPIPPRDVNKAVPLELEAVCLKCLAAAPADRYPTAEAVADDLARCRRGDPPLARPLGTMARLGRAARRRVRPLAAAVALILFGTALILGAKLPARTDPDAPLRAISRALADDREVDLIPEGGQPVWHRWKYGKVPFSESRYEDGAVAINTLSESRLVLLPAEAVPPAYRLKATLRHTASLPTTGRVGLFFAAREEAVDNVPSRTWMEMHLNDFPNRDPKFGPQNMGAWARLVVAVPRPGLPERTSGYTLGNAPYADPLNGGFNPVRTLVVEVRESGITPWVESGDEKVPFKTPFTAESLSGPIAWLRRHQKLPPADGAAWSTRGDLGLFVDYGEAAFTRVTIQRLTD